MSSKRIQWRRPDAVAVPAEAPRLILPEGMRARYSKPAKPEFIPSPQQEAYYDWLENGSGNLLMEAVAGAGKSTTLVRGFRHMRGKVLLGAYGRDAAADLKAKTAEVGMGNADVMISTMHGYGMRNWKRNNPSVQVDDGKTRKLLERFFDANSAHRDRRDVYAPFITKMMSFGKQFLIGCPDKPPIENASVWLKIMDHFGVDLDLPEDIKPEMVMEWVQELFGQSRAECPTRIDFDDMLYAPIAHRVRFWQNDWVLIDECQDINPARREAARLALKAGGRAVFVGDSRQAIYGFTGAGGDSIQRIIEEFNCTRLPLTVTYRCPKAVVNYVHQWVSHIEAHPDAPEGIVRPVKYEAERTCPACDNQGMREETDGRMTTCDYCAGKKRIPAAPWFIQDQPGIEDVILCRFTRPLIQTAYGMIKNGIACRVQGRDIGKGLINLASTWKITSIEKLEERLKVYYQKEYEKAQKTNSEKKLQELEDRVGTLRIFMERCVSQGRRLISDVIAEIEAMFSDDIEGVVTLCSGHKSKGREWPRVYWIKTGISSRITKEWEMQEEINLQYVIGTRAMRELILIPENLGKEGK